MNIPQKITLNDEGTVTDSLQEAYCLPASLHAVSSVHSQQYPREQPAKGH